MQPTTSASPSDNPDAAISHDAETQRQHVRLNLPAYVEVGGGLFPTHDWSAGGVSLEWPEGVPAQLVSSLAPGKVLDGRLFYRFDGFDLSVPMRLEVRYLSRDGRRTGCRFSQIDRRQSALLRYLTGAYIAGEVVKAGDVLDVAARNGNAAPRAIPAVEAGLSRAQLLHLRARRWIKLSGVAVASALLAVYLSVSIYERLFILKASSASVAADVVVVTAGAGGKVFYQPQALGAAVKVGEPLAMISTETGSMMSVDSPCDCILKERLVDNQSWAHLGQGLVRLVPQDAKPYVKAFFPFEETLRLQDGRKVRIGVRGGDGYAQGVVTDIRAAESDGQAMVSIAPVVPLPATLIGNPVEVRIDTLFGGKD